MTKAIALLSGGLDSMLAVKVIQEQGIEVEAVHFTSVFSASTLKKTQRPTAQSAAKQLGVKLKVFEITDELLTIVRKPKHGYGTSVNPCLDCHAFMFKRAGRYMRTTKASFLITGEVLGERPMSQTKRSLKIVEKESGLGGLIVRPLSAKLLEPTVPEKDGLVDRERLLKISGRSRKEQFKLAEKFGITYYPWPAGGCLLTERLFGNKLKDLIEHDELQANDIELLKAGRYFRLTPRFKLIVGRDQKANEALLRLAKEDDVVFEPTTLPGPTGLGRGDIDQDSLLKSCRIIAHYTSKKGSVEVGLRSLSGVRRQVIRAESMSEVELGRLRR
jgi:tRNA-specific 2-thiouridylase